MGDPILVPPGEDGSVRSALALTDEAPKLPYDERLLYAVTEKGE
ncbi:hypothetical protein [Streptomyces sp. NPDC047079]